MKRFCEKSSFLRFKVEPTAAEVAGGAGVDRGSAGRNGLPLAHAEESVCNGGKLLSSVAP